MMKILSTVLLSTLGSLLLATTGQGQYTESELAKAIAKDSNYPAASYQSYAKSLEKTLSLLSPGQLNDVFRGAAVPSAALSSSSSSNAMAAVSESNAVSQSMDSDSLSSYSESSEFNAALDDFNHAYSYHVKACKAKKDAQDDLVAQKASEKPKGLEKAKLALEEAETSFKKAEQNLDNAQMTLEKVRQSSGAKSKKGQAKVKSKSLH